MSTTSNSSPFVEGSSARDTFSRFDLIEERDLQRLSFEELLTEPNRDVADQTQIVDPNGDSNTLDLKRGQLSFFPPSRPAREHFRALQKWEGHVLKVGPDTFLARLVPIVGEGLDQEAEIFLKEVEKDDRSLIEPGAVFYWSIGYLDKPSGRYRASLIRFRRLPAWTRREIEAAKVEATKLRELFDDE